MSTQVAVRDAPLSQLTVWHDLGEDGRPACRQGAKADCCYRVHPRDTLPEDVSKCAYCTGEYTATNGLRPATLAHDLAQTDPEEVCGE